MASHPNGRKAALLDSAGPGTSRPSVSPAPAVVPHVELDNADDRIVVRIDLCEGPVELQVRRVAAKTQHPRRRVTGMNADATPC